MCPRRIQLPVVTILAGAHSTVPHGKGHQIGVQGFLPYLDDYEPHERSTAGLAGATVRPDVVEQRLGVVTCEGRGDTQSWWDEPWTVVGTAKPTRTPLHPQGCGNSLELLGRVDMVKSARRAVTGDGVCIGLTSKDQAFVHPKTKNCRELIKDVADEIK